MTPILKSSNQSNNTADSVFAFVAMNQNGMVSGI